MNIFVHKAFSSPLLIIPLDRFREMTPSGQKVAAFWRLTWHAEMSQQCSYPSAEWDMAKLPQPFHHLIIFPLKSLSVLIRSTIAASFRCLELLVRCSVLFLSGFNSALQIC